MSKQSGEDPRQKVNLHNSQNSAPMSVAGRDLWINSTLVYSSLARSLVPLGVIVSLVFVLLLIYIQPGVDLYARVVPGVVSWSVVITLDLILFTQIRKLKSVFWLTLAIVIVSLIFIRPWLYEQSILFYIKRPISTQVENPQFSSLLAPNSIPAEGESDGLVWRYVTSVNNYPVLSLSFLASGGSSDTNRKVLANCLEIDTNPFIYTDIDSFKSIQAFIQESGNQQTLEFQNELNISCASLGRGQFEKFVYLEGARFSDSGQSRVQIVDIPKDESKSNFHFESEHPVTFQYAPLDLAFQSSIQDAPYTSIQRLKWAENSEFKVSESSELVEENKLDNKSKIDSGMIIQYPSMKSLKDSAVVNLSEEKGFRADYIKNIVNEESNKNIRGFFAFRYFFGKKLEDILPIIFELCRYISGDLIFRDVPSPYVKFLDIYNSSHRIVTIDQIVGQEVRRSKYQLTDIDDRNKVFASYGRKINLTSRIVLNPRRHLIIPVEFGFDRSGMLTLGQESLLPEKEFIQDPDFAKEMFKVKIAKPVTESQWRRFRDQLEKRNWLKGFYLKALGRFRILVGHQLSDEEIWRETTGMDEAKMLSHDQFISQSFLTKISSQDRINGFFPKRFAVGSFFTINEIRGDNFKPVSVSSPANNPSVEISSIYAEGSCPYLLKLVNNVWSETGAILVGKQHKSLKTTEERDITTAARVRLEEREPEISYIDQVGFHYTLSNGQEKFVSVEDPDLKEKDEKYKKLHQGESIEIDLHGLVPPDAKNVRFSITGYYEPLPNKQIR